jgi:hypothetical protein
MMNGMYGMPHANGMVPQQQQQQHAQHAQQQQQQQHHARPHTEEPPAKRYKPAQQAQAVMQGNHGTSLVEAMNALEIQSHLDTLLVRPRTAPAPSTRSLCSAFEPLPGRAVAWDAACEVDCARQAIRSRHLQAPQSCGMHFVQCS